MSFITRCPACGTAFKVVADQLKIADGWVRCGHCQQVFDATLDLRPVPPVVPRQPADAPPTPLDTGSAPPAVDTEPPAPSAAVAPDNAGGAVVPPSEAPVVSDDGVIPGAVPRGGNNPFPEPDQPFVTAPEPSFVRQARRRAFWRRPAVRAALSLMALGLAALLAAQALWHWRDTWAAQYPPARPWLEAFCDRLGCTVAPPRRPGDVVIEGSVLLRRAPDRYSFHLVVRNRADVEVAAPALELSLTDAQDRVLVRRVWTPDAWPQPTEHLGPGAEWPLQFELAFDHPQAARMSGYQAVLFYP